MLAAPTRKTFRNSPQAKGRGEIQPKQEKGKVKGRKRKGKRQEREVEAGSEEKGEK